MGYTIPGFVFGLQLSEQHSIHLPQVIRAQRSGMPMLPQGVHPQDLPPLQGNTLSLQSLNHTMAGSPASTSVGTFGNRGQIRHRPSQ
jgi:hypothetical protein